MNPLFPLCQLVRSFYVKNDLQNLEGDWHCLENLIKQFIF